MKSLQNVVFAHKKSTKYVANNNFVDFLPVNYESVEKFCRGFAQIVKVWANFIMFFAKHEFLRRRKTPNPHAVILSEAKNLDVLRPYDEVAPYSKAAALR